MQDTASLILLAALLPTDALRVPVPRMGAGLDTPTTRVSVGPLEQALLAAKACSLAFVPPDAIPKSPYSSELSCVGQVEDPDSLAGATVFTAANGDVVIACRGSASLRNFRTNFRIGPVPLVTADGEKHPSALVHEGFQDAGRQLWLLLEPLLPATGRVLVTGHSLGGGTAHFLTLFATAAGRDASLVTVAGPRLGNAAFAECVAQSGADVTHLLHSDDEVIKSNAKLWDDLGFCHAGTVVRCDKDAPRLYDEAGPVLTDSLDPSKVSLRGVLVDHCRYLGVYIGVRAQHPSVWFRPP